MPNLLDSHVMLRLSHRQSGSNGSPPEFRHGRHRLAEGRSGFTLVEALVGLSIMVFAGAVVLLATETTIQATSDAADQAVAAGLAKQLMDEILSHPFVATGRSAYSIPIGPVAAPALNDGRNHFLDTGDYCKYKSASPVDMWGIGMGQGNEAGGTRHPNLQISSDYFRGWWQLVDVYYVSSDDPSERLSGAQVSPLRAVEVSILRASDNGGTIELANARRVIGHITGAE